MVLNLLLIIIAIAIGFLIGKYFHKQIKGKELENAHRRARSVLQEAERKVDQLKKKSQSDVDKDRRQQFAEIKHRLRKLRDQAREHRNRIFKSEDQLEQRVSFLDKRYDMLNRQKAKLDTKQKQLAGQQRKAQALVKRRHDKLEQIASFSRSKARNLIIKRTKAQLTKEQAKLIKANYDQTRKLIHQKAKNLIIEAIQQSSADIVSETTVSVINLSSDEMKGRIIGREGRNIRTFETLTGIDVIIDDTPDAVVLSGFNPIRREVAKLALEKLIKDGRIHPARIEEMVAKSRRELSKKIQEIGENTVFALGIHSMNPHLVKLVGRLKFKLLGGQSVLNHSIKVAKLSGVLAAEVGEKVTLARRAGLLHEIGLAVDHEANSSHVKIGVDLAKKYHEAPVIVDSIGAYHQYQKPRYVISELVAIANQIAILRPGAESRSLERFVRRLSNLEKISNSFDEVKKSYAIRAGHEIRVIVKSGQVSDTQAIVLARKIKRKIEREVEYPGHIKITIIREVRSVEYAE